jgi:hypothetical protein
MDFLVKLSQWSHKPAKRHELMLVSDTLGVTMLVDCINHRKMDPRATEWTVQGPFHGTRTWAAADLCAVSTDRRAQTPCHRTYDARQISSARTAQISASMAPTSLVEMQHLPWSAAVSSTAQVTHRLPVRRSMCG